MNLRVSGQDAPLEGKPGFKMGSPEAQNGVPAVDHEMNSFLWWAM